MTYLKGRYDLCQVKARKARLGYTENPLLASCKDWYEKPGLKGNGLLLNA